MNLLNKDIISIRDLDKREIEIILEKAKEMERAVSAGKSLDDMKGKVLANLFLSQAPERGFHLLAL